MNDSSPLHDCLIIGAGPAGLMAGIYLRRFHRDVRILDAGASRAKRIPTSHNCPGFPDGVSGHELLQRLRQQLEGCGGCVESGQVQQLRRDAGDGVFTAQAGARVWRSRSVVLATGVVDVEPQLPGIDALRGRALLRYCPICDGFEFSGQRIGVVGRGRHGAREALFVRNYSARVTLLCLQPGDRPDAEALGWLQEAQVRVLDGPFTGVEESAEGAATAVAEDGQRHGFDVLYAALGSTARSELASQLGAAMDASGCLTVDSHLRTSVEGLYAAGDVVSSLDQVAVALGQAAIAAAAIHNSLPPRRQPAG
ncbi:NAD(P)/FAD-dependent oxidoreductase [Eleftheria terrae]|uniref:NAD(P)/FAD-dependent oxidoreductase n=1 Tax=Eleftheria terrae TaxID=1597781 RepID=UPI00263BD221|nr:NAD(P)/FAD-dependent oxidoreductase [Eleftheria terrae]WKB51713.1 NAD(P)/FAD-dependent oxidoreductase [Eleftheria terrae]